MRILVTGSSGAIGRPVCDELVLRGDFVRGFDRTQADGPQELMLADIESKPALLQAMANIDVVLHLAANPHDSPFPELIGPNVLGLYNVLSAAQEAGVQRVVLASSVQTVGTRNERRYTAEHRSPVNHYAVTKLLAEELGAFYAQRYKMDIIAARIGWMVRSAREAKRMEELKAFYIYVSRKDIADFFYAAAHQEFSGFAVLWAIGAGGRERFDLEPARRLLGFDPQDAWPAGLPFEIPK